MNISVKICPKGTSFDDSQEDITLMMSHINSSPRQSLGGMSPLKLAKLMPPSEVIDYFGLTEIPDDEIVLTPALLQKIEPDITYESADKSLAYFFPPGKWNLVLQGTIPVALSVRLFPVNAQTMSG